MSFEQREPFVKVTRTVNRPIAETFDHALGRAHGPANRAELLTVGPGRWFSYRVAPPPAELDHVEVHWSFSDNGDDTTVVVGVYTLVPAADGASERIRAGLLARYQRRLESALDGIKNDLER
jgi:hypothetical protein